MRADGGGKELFSPLPTQWGRGPGGGAWRRGKGKGQSSTLFTAKAPKPKTALHRKGVKDGDLCVFAVKHWGITPPSRAHGKGLTNISRGTLRSRESIPGTPE